MKHLESAQWFRDRLAELDLSQVSLARNMIFYGDDRRLETIERSLRRCASGQSKVSGELKVILEVFKQCQMANKPWRKDDVRNIGKAHLGL